MVWKKVVMDAKALSQFSQFSDDKLKKHNVFSTPRFFLDIYCLAPGQGQRPHSHAEADKVYVMLEGKCRFLIGSDSEFHGEGVAVLAPAGIEHGVENPGPGPARLLVMMAPRPGGP